MEIHFCASSGLVYAIKRFPEISRCASPPLRDATLRGNPTRPQKDFQRDRWMSVPLLSIVSPSIRAAAGSLLQSHRLRSGIRHPGPSFEERTEFFPDSRSVLSTNFFP